MKFSVCGLDQIVPLKLRPDRPFPRRLTVDIVQRQRGFDQIQLNADAVLYHHHVVLVPYRVSWLINGLGAVFT